MILTPAYSCWRRWRDSWCHWGRAHPRRWWYQHCYWYSRWQWPETGSPAPPRATTVHTVWCRAAVSPAHPALVSSATPAHHTCHTPWKENESREADLQTEIFKWAPREDGQECCKEWEHSSHSSGSRRNRKCKLWVATATFTRCDLLCSTRCRMVDANTVAVWLVSCICPRRWLSCRLCIHNLPV